MFRLLETGCFVVATRFWSLTVVWWCLLECLIAFLVCVCVYAHALPVFQIKALKGD